MMGQLNFMVTVKHSYVNRPRNDSLRVGYISFSIFFFYHWISGDLCHTVDLRGLGSNEAITMLVHASPLPSGSWRQTKLQAMNEQLYFSCLPLCCASLVHKAGH